MWLCFALNFLCWFAEIVDIGCLSGLIQRLHFIIGVDDRLHMNVAMHSQVVHILSAERVINGKKSSDQCTYLVSPFASAFSSLVLAIPYLRWAGCHRQTEQRLFIECLSTLIRIQIVRRTLSLPLILLCFQQVPI